ncbi:probable outer membrane protein pmp20 [Dysidea avara]|uniref:probable outer membrane protein pmp20 n=1 Tax=Dysidea avara TaxID=196820 RepID=UPI00332CC7AB
MLLDSNSVVIFQGNKASSRGGAIYCKNCNIKVDDNSTLRFSDNRATYGGAVCCYNFSAMSFVGSSDVMFNKNRAKYGAAVYTEHYSNISSDGSTTVTHENNYASEVWGAITVLENCSIIIDGKSTVKFIKNRATFGGAIWSGYLSNLLFNGTSQVAFKGNVASKCGGAVSSYDMSSITFASNSKVTFINNSAATHGGAVCSNHYTNLSFVDNTAVIFEDNDAWENGGSIALHEKSHSTFDGYSNVTFNDNSATHGGAVHSARNCYVLFNGSSIVTFEGNNGRSSGGAAGFYDKSYAIFDRNSTVTFDHNKAKIGGAIVSAEYCYISFIWNSAVTFNGNRAIKGGAVYFEHHSNVSCNSNATVKYSNNIANKYGGAVMMLNNCTLLFDEWSKVTFNDNRALKGGAVYSERYSVISCKGSTAVTYVANSASMNGGSVTAIEHCNITFDGNSKVTCDGNNATVGGAIFLFVYSNISFQGYTKVTFKTNKAHEKGGSVNCEDNCSIIFYENSKVKYDDNKSAEGGAMFCSINSRMLFSDTANTTFSNNKARNGGAINIQHSNLRFLFNSSVEFNYNSASRSGGAIYLSDNFTIIFDDESNITFYQNNATLHGGAIYGELKLNNHSKILSYITAIDFANNTAFTGQDIYMNIQPSCDETCLNSCIVGLNITHNNPPRNLALYNPATCINKTTVVNDCKAYLVSNIMLGQNIKINACVLSFYDEPAGNIDFTVSGGSQNHHLDGTQFLPIACKLFEGISVIGKEISNKTNFSMTISSYTNSRSEASITLVTELSPCHHGFVYDNTAQKCICYDNSDTVSCSGSTSSIKKSYWFGEVNDRTTVTVCPNNYCNFSCCETANGFYQLSPNRVTQCNMHRSGVACGNCQEYYTLPFDSAKCVSINQCTTGQTVLIIMLSMIYWIVIVILLFIVTYYQVGIGYLYAITYYYSMLDILLDHNLYVSQGLFITIGITSSIAKLTPQFLGQLCLVKNMSGIDQQSIHYVHPLAVTILVAIIC